MPNAAYRIVLNFEGLTFPQIAIFENNFANSLHAHAVCQEFLLKYFCEWLKNRKIKDPRKFSAIW